MTTRVKKSEQTVGLSTKTLPPPKHRPLALVDVDHTLLFGTTGAGEAAMMLNTTLLGALKDRGIEDVFLFTDMTLSSSSVAERQEIQDVITKFPFYFRVHGVITPCDLCWRYISGAESMSLHKMCTVDNLYQGKYFGPEFQTFVESQATLLPRMARAVSVYDPSSVPGISFSEAAQEATTNEGIVSQETVARSMFSKAVGDHIAARMGFDHTKGLMLDLFLRHLPEWASSIVVCDDNMAVNETIHAFRPVPAASLPEPAPNAAPLLVSMLLVTGHSMGMKHYAKVLDAHFKRTHRESWSIFATRFTKTRLSGESPGVLVGVLPPGICAPPECLWSIAEPDENATRSLFLDDTHGRPKWISDLFSAHAEQISQLTTSWELSPKDPGVEGAAPVRLEVAAREKSEVGACGLQDEISFILYDGITRCAPRLSSAENSPVTGPWRETVWHHKVPDPPTSERACRIS